MEDTIVFAAVIILMATTMMMTVVVDATVVVGMKGGAAVETDEQQQLHANSDDDNNNMRGGSSSAAIEIIISDDDTPPTPPTPSPTIDPDSGIVINWTALDEIASNYSTSPIDEWLPPPTANCTACTNLLKYRPLYCPWYIKPFRDPYDLVVTETMKWPVSRKLMNCSSSSSSNDMLNGNHHTGMPMIAFFGTECCRVYENATQGYIALSTFDKCWYETNELQKCFMDGSRVPLGQTNLTHQQYNALIRNATYADRATPHL